MKWSVALFGFEQIIPTMGEDPVEHAAAIKRAKVGDVIGFHPYEERHKWTPNEKRLFLIVTIDGPTREQMEAMCEQEWDLDSYEPLDLMLQPDWEADIQSRISQAADPVKAQMKWDARDKDADYAEYKKHKYDNCRFPTAHKNKRRFNIAEALLESKGVDLAILKNKSIEYSPVVDLDWTEVDDKVKGRKVLATDGINFIPARTDQEIDDAQGQQGEG
jgi:hypothetical protein